MEGKNSKTPEGPSLNPDPKESDVVIGRFRKISSAKNMAPTNGGAKPPPAEPDDPEAGLLLKPLGNGSLDHDQDGFEQVTETKNRTKITKSSFRNTEKPSRFKNNPSTTRFQVQVRNLQQYLNSRAPNESLNVIDSNRFF
jgi:hypothetical protein